MVQTRRPLDRASSTDPRPIEGPPQVGESYVVKWYNGKEDEKVIATVVAIREVTDEELKVNRDEKRANNLVGEQTDAERRVNPEKMEEEEPSSGLHSLYYVHYDGKDRRLDEWVEGDRFVQQASASSLLDNGPSGSGENGKSGPRYKLTRSQRRIHEEFNHLQKSYQDMGATTAKLEKEHEERTKVKNIETVYLGENEISTWYFSPYPEPYGRCSSLYVCEFCLLYFKDMDVFRDHVTLWCKQKSPPGTQIYRADNLSVFEVCGDKDRDYAQCLCLLSKLFMDHKTLYFDVETFLFYVICEVDENGSHIVGHFSKERITDNNLACIMILPPFQRKGYGKLLIQLSYELSSREGWIGTPEKPLSDLGKVSYRSFWWWVLLQVLEQMAVETIRVGDLSETSGIARDDIISTLQPMQMVKYWKGEHIVRASRRVLDHCRSLGLLRPPLLRFHPSALCWEPVRPRGPPRKSPFQ